MLVGTGSQVLYVEFEEVGRTKRFIVPTGDNIENKIRTFSNRSSKIDLIRMGDATITSKEDVVDTGLESVPCHVEAVFSLSMNNHPALQQGTARYSTDLIKQIMEVEPEQQVQSAAPQTEAPQAPALSLTEQLKQQVQQTAQEKLSADSKKEEEQEVSQFPAVQQQQASKANPENVQNLDDFLEQKRKEKQAKKTVSAAQPISKIDKILQKLERIEMTLGLDNESDAEEDELRANQLKEWFKSHVDTVGEQRTFEILASKIKL